MKPFQADESIYGKWREGKSCLILTTHVDDLKGGGCPEDVEQLVKHLEGQFDKGKMDYDSFEHCGMKYDQTTDRKTISTDMSHYVQQLRPITSIELSV